MVANVIIVLDEGADLPFEVAGRIIVVEQDTVLQRLMPALDLPLGLGMIRRPADMLHVFAFEPRGQIVGDVARAVVAQKPRSPDLPRHQSEASQIQDAAPGRNK
jgi:hypothetical protein